MATSHFLTFGALLRRYRSAAGLTQEELAERARLSARAISDLERGVKQSPRRDTLHLLAEALALGPQARATFERAARARASSALAVSPARDDDLAPESVRAEGGVSSRAMAQPLIGRAPEVTLLERHLAGHGPPVLLFSGEPGIGKSRLLREAVRAAPGYGLRVLDGGCQRRGGQEPYAPVLGALERYLRHCSAEQQRGALEGCAWLARLLPELTGGPIPPLPAWMLPPAQERRLMFGAVVQLLQNVAGPGGTLVVLDDLQWADPDGLDLLRELVVAAPEIPLRIVGAYRDTEAHPGDPLAAMLADLAVAGTVTHRALAPLVEHQARRLLQSVLAGVDGAESMLQERVLQRAGGVPFFVLSCAQGVRDGVSAGLPWDLAQGIRQRVYALPPLSRDVLGVAAVIGRRVSRPLLVMAMGQPEGEVLAAVEATCRAHLLDEEGGDDYRFAHDVIREVVEADLGAGWRTAWHRRVAEALEQIAGDGPIDVLAYHYTRSDVHDKAVEYLERAGDHARDVAAHIAATGYYRELVDRLERRGRQAEAAVAREKLGTVLRIAAHYDEALRVLEQAAETYRERGDLEGLRRTVAAIGRVHGSRGSAEEGVRRLQPLLHDVSAGDVSEGVAALYVSLSRLYFVRGRYGDQLATAERGAELARAIGDEGILAEAEGRRSAALGMLGRIDESLIAYEQVVVLAERVGDLDTLCNTLNNIAATYLESGEVARSKPYFARALEVAERLGDRARIAFLTSSRGEAAFYAGDWVQARADFEAGVAMSRHIGASTAAANVLMNAGRLCLAEGDWDAATRYLDECVRLSSEDLQACRQAQGLLAECDLLQGHPEQVEARLAPLLDRPGLREWDVTVFLPVLAWAYLDLGRIARADEMVTEAITRARADHVGLALVNALRVRGMARMRQHRWDEAAQTLDEGLDLARRTPHPYAEGRLLHVYGEFHAARGETDLARQRWQAALAIFRRLGARKDAERVVAQLARHEERREHGC